VKDDDGDSSRLLVTSAGAVGRREGRGGKRAGVGRGKAVEDDEGRVREGGNEDEEGRVKGEGGNESERRRE